MKFKKIQTIDYEYGDEEQIKKILYSSKEPIVFKIKNFTDEFSLDYFEKHIKAMTAYCIFENNHAVAHQEGDFGKVLAAIKDDKPLKIFGQILYRHQSAEIEKHVPLWQKLPFRPRYFNKLIKVAYFFGAKGTNTEIHFDREHCCNLHLCLSGKKEFLLFTEDQSDNLYKLPFISDSLIDFSYPLDSLLKQFPRLNQAEGYRVALEKGDMLFLPKNCWHYTQYLEPSSAASYVFYPQKFFQIYGYFTGNFFLGFREAKGFCIYKWPVFETFSLRYAIASGKLKFLYKLIEKTSFIFLLPVVSILAIISHKLNPRRVF